MKPLLQFLSFTLLFAGLVSFKNNEPVTTNPNVTFKANLNRKSELPFNASTATGTATLVYNTNTKIFSLTVTYTGIKAISGHIKNGETGFAFPLSDLSSPITYTSFPLNAAQEADLNANLYVINLHSNAFLNDEIHGILIKEEYGGGSPPPPPGYDKL
jgi:hypothetical protein